MVELVRSERLDLGRVVGQTFQILGRHVGPIAGIALMVGVLTFCLSYGVGLLIGAMQFGYGTQIAGGVGGIIALALQPLAVAAITHIAIADLSGRTVGIGPALTTGVRLMLPLLSLGFATGIGIALGFVLLVVPGVMLTLRWLVATSVRVAEGPSVSRALQRSAELTRGSRWRLLALCVAYAVLAILLSLALGKLGSGIGSGFGSGDRLVTAAVQILGGTIQTVITATGISVCYMQLRQLREGATPNQLAAVFA